MFIDTCPSHYDLIIYRLIGKCLCLRGLNVEVSCLWSIWVTELCARGGVECVERLRVWLSQVCGCVVHVRVRTWVVRAI